MLPFNSTWKETYKETSLLPPYHAAQKGDIIAEVPLHAGRRLDGVHLPSRKEGKIYRWSDLGSGSKKSEASFRELIRNKKVSLIEIKPLLRLGAIGQIIVGSDMFSDKFNREKQTTVCSRVLICGKGLVNPSLRWVCNQKQISWDDDGKSGIRIADKTLYTFDPDEAEFYNKGLKGIEAQILRYWKLNGGEIYTRVPLCRPDINGVFKQIFVDGIRIISGPARQCCERFNLYVHRQRVQGKTIELLESAPIKVDRGTMGQAIGGALLMEREYAVTVSRKIVLFKAAAPEFIEGLKFRGIEPVPFALDN